MTKTFFFYDLETSGLDPRDDRIMQFAGIRTDEQLQQIGEPVNVLVALNDDTLPSPDALMVTGVTPQKTVDEGYTEAQFAEMFATEIATPDTTMVGYNNIRFDDEFMRALLWRTFRDPYEWSYADGRSRWDLLDVVRMVRALRPEGFEWPVVDGVPTNRLELLSAANGIDHISAHDALSDVEALIGIARLIRTKQPQLFEYLYSIRDKKSVQQLVSLEAPAPFVYSSGRYENDHEKTTVAYPVAEAEHGNIFVYDLRYDPSVWKDLSSEQIQKVLETPADDREEQFRRVPVKKLQYNRSPAVAPIGVLQQGDAWNRIGLSLDVVEHHIKSLKNDPELGARFAQAIEGRVFEKSTISDAENLLYDGFVSNRDKLRVEVVRNATEHELADMKPSFDDVRLTELFPRYKARNFPKTLSDDERISYEQYRRARITRQIPGFIDAIQKNSIKELTSHQEFVLTELQLWYESIIPTDE